MNTILEQFQDKINNTFSFNVLLKDFLTSTFIWAKLLPDLCIVPPTNVDIAF